MTTQKEVLKARLIDLLNVESYKKLRAIPFGDRNYAQQDLQMEFDYKMQSIMNEWNRQDKVEYIVNNGSNDTETLYTFGDLDYRNDADLDFIINKIKGIL